MERVRGGWRRQQRALRAGERSYRITGGFVSFVQPLHQRGRRLVFHRPERCHDIRRPGVQERTRESDPIVPRRHISEGPGAEARLARREDDQLRLQPQAKHLVNLEPPVVPVTRRELDERKQRVAGTGESRAVGSGGAGAGKKGGGGRGRGRASGARASASRGGGWRRRRRSRPRARRSCQKTTATGPGWLTKRKTTRLTSGYVA